jgi:hypothetical protein
VKPDADLAQLDRGKVFKQLEKILTTARIKDVQPKEVENAASAPVATNSKDVATEKAQVAVPEPK